ncbi:hypothetical protein EXIGLDRAFT_720653 [Exidia glandulosa HHB12029]|uniref:Uncharacterized protein n=1 Tax=Exidia glandulosa HHB12029 TaxID=1314781 RepID=A0A165G9C6_EXIGL|nr:hypothetical protein EXIGLDRAFT_720653 [Exidia glandulosa HHB12029]
MTSSTNAPSPNPHHENRSVLRKLWSQWRAENSRSSGSKLSSVQPTREFVTGIAQIEKEVAELFKSHREAKDLALRATREAARFYEAVKNLDAPGGNQPEAMAKLESFQDQMSKFQTQADALPDLNIPNGKETTKVALKRILNALYKHACNSLWGKEPPILGDVDEII